MLRLSIPQMSNKVLFETILQPSNSVNDLILGLELKGKNGG